MLGQRDWETATSVKGLSHWPTVLWHIRDIGASGREQFALLLLMGNFASHATST